jgi:hypothetical protein
LNINRKGVSPHLRASQRIFNTEGKRKKEKGKMGKGKEKEKELRYL